MVKIFFGNRSGVLLLLPFFIASYILINWFIGYHTAELNSTGFWGVQFNEDLWWSKISAPLLILGNALLLNNIFNRNAFMEKNIYLPALLYVVFRSFFHSFYFLSGVGVVETLLIFALMQVYKLDQNSDGRRAVFNAAFFIGLATTVYPIMMICIPFFFWIIWVLRPFQIRESALAIVGFILPLIYAGVYGSFFGIDLTVDFLSSASVEWKFPDIYVITGGVTLLMLFSVGQIFTKLSTSSIRLKKVFRVNVLLSLFTVALVGVELLVYRKIDGSSMIVEVLVLFLPYGFGEKSQRTLPTFLFYLIFFFSVGKFFISFDI
ncbi:MAG: hypothetical protein P8M19_05160 [Crocinitomicaceae bacterium]|nr:hypothetical protein [Crocinitomicaceae bacterium]MDG1657645.1 hypothetical protein [Crocinitomicaceae bacterium]MDG2441039.1 hypothetical protein [Crocinitomicaceae bacterium]